MTLIERFEFVVKFLLSPKAGWKKVGDLALSPKKLVVEFLIPFAAIVGLASIVGGVMWSHFGIFNLIIKGVAYGAEYVATVIISSFILSKLINSFEVKEENNSLLKLTIFSYAPVFFFGSIAFIIPQLGFVLNLLCLVGILFFWLGALHLMSITEERAVGFVFLSLIINAAALAISMLVIGGVFSIFF
ncbi:MAG TPA: hypothetical protein VMV56_09525 [Williamwhitmania sp.]|nr:hypothetical protein [Williamwhitmania sp.]